MTGTLADGGRLQELARLREAGQAARGREDALLDQLRGCKDALEEAKSRLRRADDDLEHSRQRAETLQVRAGDKTGNFGVEFLTSVVTIV